MAQEFGAGRLERLRKVVGNATVLSALGALLLLVIGQLIARPVLVLLQTPEEIIGNACCICASCFWEFHRDGL